MAAAMVGVAAMAPSFAQGGLLPASPLESPAVGVRKKERRALAGVPLRFRRCRNAPERRKLRANRLHISKRVKRRHRRARKGGGRG